MRASIERDTTKAISKGIKDGQYTQATARDIFVKEGERPEGTPKNCSAGLLYMAQDRLR